ncbi:GNAT family N-acetyltransferase [Bacteroides sp. 519]|uniref:GNAT family N-acetyltransferase n=1 Tax=Bacteroides sp. 519 TaxID=2302937 RepID=UPI0013D7710A|nr:GNAT family N-acetyltransferase [Bacteroides sp. 519]NDV59575.1 GNAT family N-acetyltransferase [Bacteroides sp. 519]
MALKLTSYYKGKDIPDNLPGDNIFHSKDLFLMYEAASGYDPLLIVATIKDEPVARLLAVVRRQAFLVPASLGRRCEIVGIGEYFGENIDKEAIFGVMLEHLTNEAFRSSYIIEFRNLEHALDGYKHLRANKYFAINWLRVRNSLHSVEDVEERFSPSRLRQVKNGLKNGAVVKEAETIEEIQEFSHMLHKIYSFKIRKYFPTLQFFKLMDQWLISKNLAKIYVVKYKGKIIGGSSCLYTKDNAYLWFSGGMTKSLSKQNPGILAIWAALKDAKARGCRHLEFMDVGLPFQKHGFRTFVLHFGGKQSSTRRWFKIRTNFLNTIFRKIYS